MTVASAFHNIVSRFKERLLVMNFLKGLTFIPF